MRKNCLRLLVIIFCGLIFVLCCKSNQSSDSQIISVLDGFYKEYITLKSDLSTNNHKIDSLKVKYCTQKLLRNIAMQKSKHDPFLGSQFCDSISLNTLTIQNEGTNECNYVVCYKSKNDREFSVHLVIAKDNDIFKIDSIYNLDSINYEQQSEKCNKLLVNNVALIPLGKYINQVGCNIEILIKKNDEYIITIDNKHFAQGKYRIGEKEGYVTYIYFKEIPALYSKDTIDGVIEDKIDIQNYGNAMNQFIYFNSCEEKYLHFIRKE